ncbi:MAG: undecaprenyl-diphosphate phosphatase, partial [Candidatus Saccharimonadales bacterium]
LYSGLDYEDSARFSFLLATPIIMAAGVYKLPDLFGPNGSGVRNQILVGAIAAGIAAYLSIRYLDKYFRTKRLKPFAIYSLSFGLLMIIVQLIRG